MVAIGAATVTTWIVLVPTVRLAGRKSGHGLLHNLVTQFMGLIVLAMGVQFASTGYRSFRHAG